MGDRAIEGHLLSVQPQAPLRVQAVTGKPTLDGRVVIAFELDLATIDLRCHIRSRTDKPRQKPGFGLLADDPPHQLPQARYGSSWVSRLSLNTTAVFQYS